jgi:5-methylcytosine-specific restriction enzyme A
MSRADHKVPWNAWYDSAMWRRRSRLQRKQHPLCEDCEKRGLVVPAEVADHVVPHKGDWQSFRLGALRSLCKACHDGHKKQTELRGYSTEIDEDGWPVDGRHPAYQRRLTVGGKRA